MARGGGTLPQPQEHAHQPTAYGTPKGEAQCGGFGAMSGDENITY